jgi:hypothetical protein
VPQKHRSVSTRLNDATYLKADIFIICELFDDWPRPPFGNCFQSLTINFVNMMIVRKISKGNRTYKHLNHRQRLYMIKMSAKPACNVHFTLFFGEILYENSSVSNFIKLTIFSL